MFGLTTSNMSPPVDSIFTSAPKNGQREMSNGYSLCFRVLGIGKHFENLAPFQNVLKVDMRIQALEVQVWRCLSLLQHMHTPAVTIKF